MTIKSVLRAGAVVVLVFCLSRTSLAQSDYGFRFVRVQYGDNTTGWVSQFGESWAHDYPTAEQNLYEALERTTKIRVERPSLILKLDDPRIFEYPVLYLCEPGYWDMEEEEVTSLREYLNRGGFILFDDFRSQDEWWSFYRQIKRVFPDREPVELPADHPIWSIYYDVDPVAAPSLVGGRGRRGGRAMEDRYFGVFDDDGRLMMLACYNQDIGDGWEWPDANIGDASLVAFQMGINFLIYALTH